MFSHLRQLTLPGAGGGIGHNPAYYGCYMDWLCVNDHLHMLAISKVAMDYRVDGWTVKRKGGGAVVARLTGASKLKVRGKANLSGWLRQAYSSHNRSSAYELNGYEMFSSLVDYGRFLPRLFLLQVTTILDRNAFLFDNTQLISTDFRVLKTQCLYALLLLFSEALFALERCTMNTFMNLPVPLSTSLWTVIASPPFLLLCAICPHLCNKINILSDFIMCPL
nr:uncharacterized protein LOC106034008 [Anser cygnoides]